MASQHKKLIRFREHCERAAIELAMLEDIYEGDITTIATVPKKQMSRGIIRAKSDGVLAGLRVAKLIFDYSRGSVKFVTRKKDGDAIKAGDVIAEVYGKTSTLLVCERTVLNFMQRMSGIATKTARYVSEVRDSQVKILDTRKTAPALRFFDKEAVKLGGGTNHRIGLYDMMLIKDNHVDASGGIGDAIDRAKEFRQDERLSVKIEIEVRSIGELLAALSHKPEIILIDNFNVAELKKAVRLARSINPKIKLEASGGVTLNSVRKIAETGVDFISVGDLTHSVQAMDISMKISTIIQKAT